MTSLGAGKMDKKPLISKRLTVGIILLFVGTCVIPAIAQTTEKPSASRGNWLYVGGSGPGNYTRIQDAVDNATDGDTVYVYADSSPYFEHVKVNKSLFLLGENRDTTIIDANGSESPVILQANNATVSGFTLQNSGHHCFENAGIYIKNSDGISDSNNNTIIGNNIIQNHHGFYGYDSKNNRICNNIMRDNDHDAIYCDRCDSTIIQNNTIVRNQDGICIWSSKFVQINKNIIDDNYEFGVEFHDLLPQVSTFHEVNNNSITRHRIGLVIWTERNTIKYNYIANNSYGIRLIALPLYGARWNVFQSNTIAYNNEIGLIIESATWCKIVKNNFIGNAKHACFFYFSFIKIIAPFFGHFFQMNTFYRNYWSNGSILLPYVISGEMEFFTVLAISLFYLYALGFIHTPPEIQINWFPARQPYDIPGVI